MNDSHYPVDVWNEITQILPMTSIHLYSVGWAEGRSAGGAGIEGLSVDVGDMALICQTSVIELIDEFLDDLLDGDEFGEEAVEAVRAMTT